MSSKKTVQHNTALEENAKQKILANDFVRRMINTKEDLDKEVLVDITDRYAQKLVDSGYSKEQARRIIINGIRGFGSRQRRCEKEGRRLRRTGKESRGARTRNKLIGKSSWFKSKPKEDLYKEGKKTGQRKDANKNTNQGGVGAKKRSVLFVEQTCRGELASRLREAFTRLEKITGMGVKVVERAGTTIKNLLPTMMGEKAPCGRKECLTCRQDGEHIPDCSKMSLVYENICLICNPKAGNKEDLVEMNKDTPSLYVGESSRSIKERISEHWRGWRLGKTDNHIVRHQQLHHGGDKEPKFVARSVQFFKSALQRQVGEAVRICRRGGEAMILNSKSEYNRCRIPRLVVEEMDTEALKQEEELNKRESEEKISTNHAAWERRKTASRREERKNIAKTSKEERVRGKRRVYDLIEDN